MFYAWAFAIIGPVFLVLGVRSFFVDSAGSMYMLGRPVETFTQKMIFTAVSLVMTVIGIGFIVRGRRR